MTLAQTLFRRGLLPAHSRRTMEIPHSLQAREESFFGLMSRFVDLNPTFVRYLEDQGVVWRIAKKDGKVRTHNLIKVLTDRDAEIVRNAFELDNFYADADFCYKLKDLGYPFAHLDQTQYRLFNRAQMMDLLLRFEWTKPHGVVRFDK